MFACPFSMSKSMSDNSRQILLLGREPLKHSNADLSNANDTLALIDGEARWPHG